MNLPSFWRRASFSVAEAADLLGVPEMTLRTWLARVPFTEHLGTKTAGRVSLSGVDIYFWSLVRDFAGFGMPVRLAMGTAKRFAAYAVHAVPDAETLVVTRAGPDSWRFELVDSPRPETAAALVIALRSRAIDLVERAAVVYSTESN